MIGQGASMSTESGHHEGNPWLPASSVSADVLLPHPAARHLMPLDHPVSAAQLTTNNVGVVQGDTRHGSTLSFYAQRADERPIHPATVSVGELRQAASTQTRFTPAQIDERPIHPASLRSTQNLLPTRVQAANIIELEAVKHAEAEMKLLSHLRQTQEENAVLRRELGNIDPNFFEDLEDMKYR